MSSALKDAITQFIDASDGGNNGLYSTGIDGLHIMRSTELKMPHAMVYRPALCVIVQGAKQLMLNDRVIDYAEMQALIISIELPAAGKVVEASEEKPYMAISLEFDVDKGKRGVSISVSADSASGGFIVPNDHVDVILTRNSSGGETSETLLSNVRVLAINTRLGETGKTGSADDGSSDDNGQGPKSQVFANSAIATLELDPVQAETIINATSVGRLSLALRSIVDFAQANDDDAQLKRNAPIRIIRYGQDTSVMTGQAAAGGGSDASVNPASFKAPSVSVGTQVTPE